MQYSHLTEMHIINTLFTNSNTDEFDIYFFEDYHIPLLLYHSASSQATNFKYRTNWTFQGFYLDVWVHFILCWILLGIIIFLIVSCLIGKSW